MPIGAMIDGAFDVVTSYITGQTANGEQIAFGHASDFIAANGVVAEGDVLVRVVPTATQQCRVAKTGASATGWTIAGVARTPASAAGKVVEVVTEGYTLVNVGATTPAAGDVCIVSATAGQADVIAAGTGIVAATLVGTVLGEYMGVKNASNLALIYYRQM